MRNDMLIQDDEMAILERSPGGQSATNEMEIPYRCAE